MPLRRISTEEETHAEESRGGLPVKDLKRLNRLLEVIFFDTWLADQDALFCMWLKEKAALRKEKDALFLFLQRRGLCEPAELRECAKK